MTILVVIFTFWYSTVYNLYLQSARKVKLVVKTKTQVQHRKCICLAKCGLPGGITPRKKCELGHFQSNLRIVTVAMATLIRDFASWKSSFQIGPYEDFSPWSSRGLHPQNTSICSVLHCNVLCMLSMSLYDLLARAIAFLMFP